MTDCKCAFSRIQFDDFTCLVKEELDTVAKLLGREGKQDVKSMYKQLLKEYNCKDDYCLKEYLQNVISSDKLQLIYGNALRIQTDVPQGQELLSNFMIDRIGAQIMANSKYNYKYGGCRCYDEFEDCLLDSQHQFNPSQIVQYLSKNMQTIPNDDGINEDIIDFKIPTEQKETKRESRIGYVLNTCHKYSPGQHWTAMCIRASPGKIEIYHYNSQSTKGPETGIIQCPMNHQTDQNIIQKYQNYKSRYLDWYKEFGKVAKKNGFKLFTHYNLTESQLDQYSCGYHAVFFNYIFSCSNKPFDYITIKVLTEDDKSLDRFMVQFHSKIYI